MPQQQPSEKSIEHQSNSPLPLSSQYLEKHIPSTAYSLPRRSGLSVTTSPCQAYEQAEVCSQPSRSPSPFILRSQALITKFFVEWWLVEILCWCASLVSLAAIIVILIFCNGRPIPVWPLGLTLSGLISFLSGIAKSALLLPTAESIGQLKWVNC
jgi:hypothetical protein